MKLGQDMMEDILKKSATKYLSYREEHRRLELLMLSPIEVIAPGEIGLDEQEWKPMLEDKDGNPIIQKFGPNAGEPMEPWSKVEVKVKVTACEGDKSLVDDVEKYLRLSGFGKTETHFLKCFLQAMKKEEIDNDDLPGTKWSIYGEKEGNFWRYVIEYVGDEEVSDTPTNPIKKAQQKKPKAPSNLPKEIVDALAVKKDQSGGTSTKTDILSILSFATQKKPSEVETEYWQTLVDEGLVKEDGDKVTIN